jgi:hypothetical protein
MNVESESVKPNQGKITIVLVFLACALPIVLAFYLYFFNKPDGTNNYGTILDPQVNVATDIFKNINGEDFTMQQVANKWVLVQAIRSDCDEVCQNALYFQRQARASKGKEQSRIERVVFITDNGPLETMLLRQFPNVHFIRATESQLHSWLPLKQGLVGSKGSADIGTLYDHVFVVDPLGHVMMRFPPNSRLEFDRFRKDISRLLWASNIG